MGRRRDPSLPVPSDEKRCTRSDGKRWRCYFPRFGTNSYCYKHYLAYLSKLTHPPPLPQNPNPNPNPQPGQIWAYSQPPDPLPRHYARIDRLNPLHITPLLPHPVLAEEIRSVDGGRPIACGTFRPCSKNDDAAEAAAAVKLAFEVSEFEVVEWMGIPFYRIFPNKDEVWSVRSDKEGGEQKVVEVLSDFKEEEGVAVAVLVPVQRKGLKLDDDDDGGGGVCYERHLHEGFWLVQTFGRKEMVMFSHRILATKVEGGDKKKQQQMWRVL